MPDLRVEQLALLGIGPLSLAVPAGSCLGLSGASGSGKTRVLRALADLDPHTGQVWLDDLEQAQVAAPQWRRLVGLLPAEPRFWLATAGHHLGRAAADWLPRLGLAASLLDQPVKRLSSGERQRLGLLRLLLGEPRVLLLDEPTANLDQDSTLAVEALVAEYRRQRGAAVLWVGHQDAQLQRVAERRAAIRDGQLRALP